MQSRNQLSARSNCKCSFQVIMTVMSGSARGGSKIFEPERSRLPARHWLGDDAEEIRFGYDRRDRQVMRHRHRDAPRQSATAENGVNAAQALVAGIHDAHVRCLDKRPHCKFAAGPWMRRAQNAD